MTGVENQIEVNQNPGNVPGLQGISRRPGDRADLLQNNWSPATRLLVGATGAHWLSTTGGGRIRSA